MGMILGTPFFDLGIANGNDIGPAKGIFLGGCPLKVGFSSYGGKRVSHIRRFTGLGLIGGVSSAPSTHSPNL
jgi:hypothetical protein